MILHHLLQLSILLISVTCITSTIAPLPHDESVYEFNYLMNENTLHWITTRSFEKKSDMGYKNVVHRNGSRTKNWYSTEDVAYNSHTGTHLDAPCHFAENKWCVHEIPIEHLMNRPVCLLDVRPQVEINGDYQVTVADLKEVEKTYWVPNGSLLFISTGWSRKWPIRDDYFGIRGREEGMYHFPGLSSALADYVVESGKYVGVGIEGPSVDPGMSTDKYVHRTLYSSNIYGIENLPNLSGIMAGGAAMATIAPLKVEGASGSPVRIFVKNVRSRQSANSAASLPNGSNSARISYRTGLCLLVSLISFFYPRV